jgi:hypothetical protein
MSLTICRSYLAVMNAQIQGGLTQVQDGLKGLTRTIEETKLGARIFKLSRGGNLPSLR